MIFVFVDETGDPGKRNILSLGSTPYFGMVAISIMGKDCKSLRLLLSQIHWLRGTASSIELRRTYNKSLDLMRGLTWANFGRWFVYKQRGLRGALSKMV